MTLHSLITYVKEMDTRVPTAEEFARLVRIGYGDWTVPTSTEEAIKQRDTTKKMQTLTVLHATRNLARILKNSEDGNLKEWERRLTRRYERDLEKLSSGLRGRRTK